MFIKALAQCSIIGLYLILTVAYPVVMLINTTH